MKTTVLGSLVLGLLVVAGCTSSRIVSSWKNPELRQQQFDKILVLGLINDKDRALRVKMEDHLVGDLKELGYEATCSCDEFSPKLFENLNEKKAITKLKNSGYDAVLTVVLLDKTRERYYVPGRVYYSPYIIYHRRFWGYYTTIYDRVYEPGYYQTNTKYFWESNLYSLKDDRELLYSVQTRSFDPSSASTLAHEYGKMIVDDMVKNNVLAYKMPGQRAF